MEPIRLQHMIPTFPYFQLLRLVSLVTDLGLTAGSYLDTYDPRSGKWEQHTISTVRLVEGQQRLLYRIRKSLLEGISENDCPGLSEEVRLQSPPNDFTASPTRSPGKDVSGKRALKRPAPESSTPAAKVHISNNYYMPSPSLSSSVATLGSSSSTAASPAQSFDATSDSNFPTPNPSNPPPPNNTEDNHQPFYTVQSSSAPQYVGNAQSSMTTIPYHPHPPLKRWPNDYTVSELTTGFHAMEMLIAQSPAGTALTQRAAFERVFGSRYVKSTVCRHRGVWRKAQGPLREQYEAMGNDERACWGEFVRRFEGRAAKNTHPSNPKTPQAQSQPQSGLGPPIPVSSVMLFRGGPGNHVMSGNGSGGESGVQAQLINQREGDSNLDVEGPIMDSLQKP